MPSLELTKCQYNVLNLCYAQLELDSKYLKAVTPFYSVFDIKSRSAGGWSKVRKESTPAAQTIRKYWKEKRTSGSTVRLDLVLLHPELLLTSIKIDVVEIAEKSGANRDDLARKISDWELSGSCR